MTARKKPSFDSKSLKFLAKLARNNDRDWFKAHKEIYENDVLDPALTFIQAMHDPLQNIAPHFCAVPKRMGGSLMRVYRDTRFSKDKTPYKTNIGIQFRHELARDVHAPGYYVHIEPDQAFVGVGMWRPASSALALIRQRIVEKPDAWLDATTGPKFRRQFRLGGESLSRPPRGFDKSHLMIDDLKRKDFIAIKELTVEDVTSLGFQRKVETGFRVAESYMRFLCKAVGVPF